jgi:hypothetical protein
MIAMVAGPVAAFPGHDINLTAAGAKLPKACRRSSGYRLSNYRTATRFGEIENQSAQIME